MTSGDSSSATARRAWYDASIASFIEQSSESIIGRLTRANSLPTDPKQVEAWSTEINLLKGWLKDFKGSIYLEFNIPRMGRRIDTVLLIGSFALVIEFKVGTANFDRSGIDQVWDYALDLKNFHAGSHDLPIIPILIATQATESGSAKPIFATDRVSSPLLLAPDDFKNLLNQLAEREGLEWHIDSRVWETSPYRPTPTIIEAARALYAQHSVEAVARHDAGTTNLRVTSRRIEALIEEARQGHKKIICFITGVPGAGKTLVGLNVATQKRELTETHAVFLSGNGPLVEVLRAALTRDEKERNRLAGVRKSKRTANPVKAFIQNVHHFRDEALIHSDAPDGRVVIFDEAQRAWNLQKTADFMKKRKGRETFTDSEPAFLIRYMDRHQDWAVVICLVGGGQEIHTGEAGIGEWIHAANEQFPDWELHISSKLADNEYAAGRAIDLVRNRTKIVFEDHLHLAVSMRSFRAEHVSGFVKALLDGNLFDARQQLERLDGRFPIVMTRSLEQAREWVRHKARGSERIGLVASSKAMRLKPHAIDVRVSINPVHWFLNDRTDVRSSDYLEDCATEFQVQGLELDWTCVNWDGDLRHAGQSWTFHDFRGTRWENVKNKERQGFLLNAYRVLLTRARQGMVLFIPPGSGHDPTRSHRFYDPTFQYLQSVGVQEL